METGTTEIAEQMRRHIVAHLHEGVTAGVVAAAAGYSLRHANRLFCRATGHSIAGYIRLLHLTDAASEVAQGEHSILDVALAHGYDSHEGFTKAFSSAFGIAPRAYRKGFTPIPYFIPYPVSFTQIKRNEDYFMANIVTATFVARPARTLLFLPSKTGTDYWTFCQEMGCDWEGLLLSIPARMDTPALITFPPGMVPAGCAPAAAAIELPVGHAVATPPGYHTLPLPAGNMLYFQTHPYEDEQEFALHIGAAFAACEAYNPAPFGYAFAPEAAPIFNFGAKTEWGAKIAVPVEKTVR